MRYSDYLMAAEGPLQAGADTAAVRSLEKALAIDPSHEKARRLFEKIR